MGRKGGKNDQGKKKHIFPAYHGVSALGTASFVYRRGGAVRSVQPQSGTGNVKGHGPYACLYLQ